MTPERVCLGEEAVAAVIHALEQLAERARTAFVMHHFEDLSLRQVAQHLGVSLSTVEKDIAKANQLLLQRLRGME